MILFFNNFAIFRGLFVTAYVVEVVLSGDGIECIVTADANCCLEDAEGRG